MLLAIGLEMSKPQRIGETKREVEDVNMIIPSA